MRPLALLFALCLFFSCCPGYRQHDGDTCVVLFTGDVLLDRGVAAMARAHGADYLWQGVDSLFHTAHAVVVNLECPVTTRCTPVNKRFVFRASPSLLPAMAQAGVTHAVIANNHTMDQGSGGLADTDSLLRLHGITPLGAAGRLADNDPLTPVFISPRQETGVGENRSSMPSVAILSAVQMPVENWTFSSDYADVCCASTDSLVSAVRRFKAAHPNAALVLCLHWGQEYSPHCSPRQMRDAHRLIDAGADAIVGHHPHVLQNHEIYKGRPIYYSLGNFIFDNPRLDTRQTAVLSLAFTFTPSHLTSTSSLTFSSLTVTSRLHPATITNTRPLLCNP